MRNSRVTMRGYGYNKETSVVISARLVLPNTRKPTADMGAFFAKVREPQLTRM
jgi:hypothetical protein